MQNNALRRLGIPQMTRKQTCPEISERIRRAKLWCSQHWPLMTNSYLNNRFKFQLYKFFVLPILTYGCEIWTLNRNNSRKLLRFEYSILRKIYESKYPQRHPKRLHSNIATVYKRYRNVDVIYHVTRERLRWTDLLKCEEKYLKRICRKYDQGTLIKRVHWSDS